ncbi:STAS domain-containing protein [Streptomyces sp. NPDC091267]|uniref:STAS domain-containing protein n=1 Tax=unclassified Streptomyces TaxID=2593676 RepID=UPI0034472BAF
MTTMPRPSFTLTVEAGPGTARVHLAGDLEYDTTDELLRRVDRCLTEQPHLRDLHLDCAQLRLCDSMGLSSFIEIRRSTAARDVRLHLDNPPPFLGRMLTITGVSQLFGPARETQRAEQARADEGSPSTTTPLRTPTV